MALSQNAAQGSYPSAWKIFSICRLLIPILPPSNNGRHIASFSRRGKGDALRYEVLQVIGVSQDDHVCCEDRDLHSHRAHGVCYASHAVVRAGDLGL